MQQSADWATRDSRKSVVSILGAARPLAVVAGALVALQSSQSLDLAKFAFFAVASLALAGSVFHAWTARTASLTKAARPWLIASVVIGAIVGLSLPIALVNGTAVGTWVRDAAAYALLAASPWLALDLGAAVSPRVAILATAVAGSVATLSFTVHWVHLRNIGSLPLDRLGFPSVALATAFFALGVARSVWGGRDRFAWAVAACLVVYLLLVTGTRSTVALAAIPIVLLVDRVWIAGRSTLRTSFAPAVAPLLVAAMFVVPGVLASLPAPSAGSGGTTSSNPSGQVAIPTPTGDSGGRFGTLEAVAAGTDPSLRDRWAQTVSAWRIFAGAPLLGRGPGVPIPWTKYDGTLYATFTADTPITILAKFGVFGIVIWVALGWATLLTLRRLRRHGWSGFATRSAFLGFVTGLIVLSPFATMLEDKGASLALILLLGLAFAVIRTSHEDEPSSSTAA